MDTCKGFLCLVHSRHSVDVSYCKYNTASHRHGEEAFSEHQKRSPLLSPLRSSLLKYVWQYHHPFSVIPELGLLTPICTELVSFCFRLQRFSAIILLLCIFILTKVFNRSMNQFSQTKSLLMPNHSASQLLLSLLFVNTNCLQQNL